MPLCAPSRSSNDFPYFLSMLPDMQLQLALLANKLKLNLLLQRLNWNSLHYLIISEKEATTCGSTRVPAYYHFLHNTIKELSVLEFDKKKLKNKENLKLSLELGSL